jgi:hypothetical protein
MDGLSAIELLLRDVCLCPSYKTFLFFLCDISVCTQKQLYA